MKKPNFLVVGAQKSGSTTLYHLLKQHPDIFLPEFKEPLFFISEIIKNISDKDVGFRNEGLKDKLIYNKDDYYALFDSCNDEKMIGEASASYLYYHQHSIPLIKKELGDPKIIIILRSPISKVYSQYKHLYREHAEKITFEEGLKLEDQRVKENYTAMYHYKSQGLYYDQVKDYLDNFSNVLVLFNDDLKSNAIDIASKCYEFLNVNESFTPKEKDYNVTIKRPRNLFLHRKIYNEKNYSFKMQLQRIIGAKQYQFLRSKYLRGNFEKIDLRISDETRDYLCRFFKNDIEKLEDLLKKDLSHWKN